MMGMGNGRGGPPPRAKHTETNYKVDLDRQQAFGTILVVERLVHESKIVHLSGSINEIESVVRSVGSAIDERADIKPGDRIVFAPPAVSLECLGPSGGAMIALNMQQVLMVDRTHRGINPVNFKDDVRIKAKGNGESSKEETHHG